MADRSIKLTTKLPQGDANGLADPEVIRQLLDDPLGMRVGIVLFKVAKVEVDHESGVSVGKAEIRRIETILDDSTGDATALRRTLMRAFERRTGATTLDADLEDDVRDAFRGVGLDDQ